MPKIQVNIEFNSIEEATSFFVQTTRPNISPNTGLQQSQSPPTPAPSVASSPAGSAAPTPAAGDQSPLPLAPAAGSATTSAASSSSATSPTSSGDVPDFIKAARVAMSTYMAKFPSGQGAVKAKEILKAHGLDKIAGATEAQCAALVTAFQTAA